jgi:hypothetical protein
MRLFLMYLKFYFEPNNKDVRALALASAHEFWKGDTNIAKTIDNFQAYQHGYIGAFRHSYAKAKLENL